MTPDQSQDFYLYVGSRIRQAREERGLTQEGLATLLDLTRTSITNVEKGRQKLLLHTFAELAKVLKVDPGQLLPQTSVAIPEENALTGLEDLLKDRSQQEQEWIKAAMGSGIPTGEGETVLDQKVLEEEGCP